MLSVAVGDTVTVEGAEEGPVLSDFMEAPDDNVRPRSSIVSTSAPTKPCVVSSVVRVVACVASAMPSAIKRAVSFHERAQTCVRNS